MIKVLHYLNQFFAGIGGEEKAGQEVLFLSQRGRHRQRARKRFQRLTASNTRRLPAAITIFMKTKKKRCERFGAAIDQFHPDIFLAGPAFNAGRYGIACAKVCSWVRDNWRIPAITGMHEDNPGTREIGRHVFVLQTGASAASMQDDLETLFAAGRKANSARPKGHRRLSRGILLGDSAPFYVRTDKPDYVRAADLLLAKLSGQSYESEIPRIETQAHHDSQFDCFFGGRHRGAGHRRRSGAERQSRSPGKLARLALFQIFAPGAQRSQAR